MNTKTQKEVNKHLFVYYNDIMFMIGT